MLRGRPVFDGFGPSGKALRTRCSRGPGDSGDASSDSHRIEGLRREACRAGRAAREQHGEHRRQADPGSGGRVLALGQAQHPLGSRFQNSVVCCQALASRAPFTAARRLRLDGPGDGHSGGDNHSRPMSRHVYPSPHACIRALALQSITLTTFSPSSREPDPRASVPVYRDRWTGGQT